MVGGFVGLACTENYSMATGKALFFALLAGSCMLLVTACMMRLLLKLQHKGALFSTQQTRGLVATVYQEIPAHGQGKIQITVHNRTHELLAQSHDKRPIESFTQVIVTRVVDHAVVEVQKITL